MILGPLVKTGFYNLVEQDNHKSLSSIITNQQPNISKQGIGRMFVFSIKSSLIKEPTEIEQFTS